MSIDKFGITRQYNTTSTLHYQWSGLVRNYVRDNALCRTTIDFDARLRKIRRLAPPEADTDAVTKQYVEQCVETLKNMHEEIEKRLVVHEKEIRALQNTVNELQRTIYATHEKNVLIANQPINSD